MAGIERMGKLLSLTEIVNRVGVWVGGLLMFFTSAMIAVEVVLRKVFAISMGGADEISSYVLAISCSWAFGFALLRKAHIRIDIFYAKMGQRLQSLLDLLSLLTFLVYQIPLVYFAWLVVKTSIIRNSAANTPLHTPLWIPQGLWFLGLVCFLLTTVVLLVSSVARLARGDLEGARALTGPNTIEDEIKEEGASLPEAKTPSDGGFR
ncbi:TRAP-type mannitol/chloroaromatic compound transport system, small permease component [Desulfofustis glycolicus DSM 9705]|uniref:TRAP-type mannitol/chloroaromatic compound transport system, small permease component n=2 Tax=Desulfofustis glycolicus TaxID=51195 RepID=A0A1M5Y7D9_9BACT|nr:TRAP-type mannitol/chloroaromatic compound transport system, small permease component [Desulfofustis glycolicus DSM 9705]